MNRIYPMCQCAMSLSQHHPDCPVQVEFERIDALNAMHRRQAFTWRKRAEELARAVMADHTSHDTRVAT